MRRSIVLFAIALVVAAPAAFGQAAAPATDWGLNATIIEACSCPMFCQCYFASKPAGHAGHEGHGAAEHYCRFNNAFRVNTGSYGNVKLDGAKFWVAGDLGDDFSDGEMNWAVLTFDPSVKPDQRKGIQTALGKLYPVKWQSFTVGPDAPIDWTATKDHAEAHCAAGKNGDVVLSRFQGMTNDPIVIQNLKYWGAPRNEGFVLMPNEVEAWRAGDKPFEFKGTNGFMITFDIASKDFK